MKVKVHRNLNAPKDKVLWSITPLSGTFKGKVLAHAESIVLSDCKFKISKAGQARVIKSHTRSVFAWCIGNIEQCDLFQYRYDTDLFDVVKPVSTNTRHLRRILFNPFFHTDFTFESGKKVEQSDWVVFNNKGQCLSR
jgi:hypothetical protein